MALSGEFERVHYALVLAAGQAALGRPATLFFTLAAIRALMVDAHGAPGWRALPSVGGMRGADIDARYRASGVGGFEELLEACVSLGVEFIVCEMVMRAEGVTRAELRSDIPILEAGVVTLLRDGASSVISL